MVTLVDCARFWKVNEGEGLYYSHHIIPRDIIPTLENEYFREFIQSIIYGIGKELAEEDYIIIPLNPVDDILKPGKSVEIFCMNFKLNLFLDKDDYRTHIWFRCSYGNRDGEAK